MCDHRLGILKVKTAMQTCEAAGGKNKTKHKLLFRKVRNAEMILLDVQQRSIRNPCYEF